MYHKDLDENGELIQIDLTRLISKLMEYFKLNNISFSHGFAGMMALFISTYKFNKLSKQDLLKDMDEMWETIQTIILKDENE